MKTKIVLLIVVLLGINFRVFAQNHLPSTAAENNWKIFSEVDMGILAFTGGYANYFGIRKGPHSYELGYQHFDAPSEEFSGKPEGFDLTIDYIYSVHYSYFWNGQTDKGLYTRIMYHNKKQIVTEKTSGISKSLYSDLIGFEVGYVWKFYKGFYLAPRVGALYYINSPQGKNNEPVKIGDSYYDNDRHKTWDTYFIPTVSFGYSLSLK